MTSDQLADLSRVLYSPTTLILYLGAAFVYLYALTTTMGRTDQRERGQRVRQVGAVLAVLGMSAHLGHEIVRGIAQTRLPLGNMFEVSSLMALVGVVAGWSYLTFVRRRPELNGFVFLVGSLVLGMAMLMYAEPGPLMPILDTWWRPFHVSLLVGAMGIFAAAFMFTALYLMRDSMDRQLARMTSDSEATGGRGSRGARSPARHPQANQDHDGALPATDRSTPPAGGQPTVPASPAEPAHASTAASVATADVDATHADDTVLASATSGAATAAPDGAEMATTASAADADDDGGLGVRRAAVRAGVPAWRLALGTFLGTSIVSWVWWHDEGWASTAGVVRFLTVNLAMVAAALLARRLVPYLPAKETLDGVAHRTVAFAFIMWTVGTILGAMWAEMSWGRFWGWDPKETGAFLTWVAYAGYLHARATRGVQGRRAAWIGIGAFVVLMATYLVANYVVVGLHSYADL